MTEFPYVYVIHMEKRTDRYKQFNEAWKSVGFPTNRVHWFPATEGIKLPESVFEGFHTVARTHKARAGRLGAYLSHTNAIAAAIEVNHFPLLIMEDDAIPTKELTRSTQLEKLFSSVPSTANLLYLGALPVKDRKADKTFCARRRSGWMKRAPVTETQLYGGHAYGFPTREAAEHVLGELLKTRITFDSALVRYQKHYPGKVAIYCPFMFQQAEGYSDIEGVQRWTSRSRRRTKKATGGA